MKRLIILVVYCFGTVFCDMSGECDFVSFYQELGCTAIPNDDNLTCPKEFDCPDLHPNPNMCYYRGVEYADRATIPMDLVKNPCALGCVCTIDSGPRFDCAAVDCVENFDPDQQECIYTFSLDSCCSTGEVCGKDAIASLKTCEADGKTYKEGQYFEPANSRKKCVCTADWNGSYDDPATCSDINCGLEIYNQKNIMDKCAPVFVKTAKSCPFSFQCPSAKTKIIKGINLRGIQSQCVFGNLTLNVGDEVVGDDSCTKCSCEVPPFMTCVKTTYSCPN
ncbi:unnamed protein product [Danaus chrysippus]|uniref:(African queen) hypothetical protein n=1 Tax=Danaus chrysippus TaxID=151541 RepID=A0A8J2WB64_9NEOP|nr:unnamed protein product [Danaus chrysippus]